jgi:hypothetical protein
LKYSAAATLKCDRAAGKISKPEAGFFSADLVMGGGFIRQEAIVPEVAGPGVMLAPAFHVVNFKSKPFEVGDPHAEVVEVAAGKYIARHCGIFGPVFTESLFVALGRPTYGVMQIESLGLQ